MDLIDTEVFFTTISVLIFLGFNIFLRVIIQRFGSAKNLPIGHQKKLIRVVRFVTGLLLMLVLMMVWGFEIQDMWIFATTILGLLGIAIFAAWSLLSNIFAAYILFFSEPFGIGDTITYMDATNSVTGEVIDTTLFFVRVKMKDGGVANIPNNIILQKTVIRHNEIT